MNEKRMRKTPRSRAATLSVLCLSVLMAQIDTSVVNLAMHPIGACFSASMAELQWALDSYNLVYAVLLLTGGILADLWGRRRTFMLGVAIFAAASLLCAVSSTISILTAGRAISGLGAALMIPSSLAVIRVEWPDQTERGRALGIWAGCYGLALVIGPTLGGMLIGQFGWRSIFLIAVPIGLAALAWAPLAIPESSDPHGRRFDFPAQILGALAIGSLAFAAIVARNSLQDAFFLLAAAMAAFRIFIAVESKKGGAALVPLGIFKIAEFRGAAAGAAGMTFGMYGLLFVLPLAWLEAGKLDLVEAGLALMPMALVYVPVSAFSGQLVHRFGIRIMACGGVAVIGAGMLFLAASSFSGTVPAEEVGLVLTGLGMGFATGPLLGLAVSAVPAARSGTAASLINVVRMIGATMGVAVLGSIFAALHDRILGLILSMSVGGAVQLACAMMAWRFTRQIR